MEVKLGTGANPLGQLADLAPAKEDMLSLYTQETSEWDPGQFPVSTAQVTNLGLVRQQRGCSELWVSGLSLYKPQHSGQAHNMCCYYLCVNSPRGILKVSFFFFFLKNTPEYPEGLITIGETHSAVTLNCVLTFGLILTRVIILSCK